MNVPPGWKSLPLLDLITEDQFERIWSIIVSEKDPIKRVRKISVELNKVRAQLGAKGVDPDYLAYFLEYSFGSRPEGKS